jgi:uncharacterized protein (DUF58 family)
MQRRYTARFQLLLLGAFTTLLLAAFSGPAVIVAGSPIILLLALGLLWPHTPFGVTNLATASNSSVCFEGDVVQLQLCLEGFNTQRHRLEISNQQSIIGAFNIQSPEVFVEIRLPMFGSYNLAGSVLIREGHFGLFEDCLRLELAEPIKVFPVFEDVTPLARMVKTQFALGRHRSNQQSHAGLEFVDVREAGPGDPLTDVNWKVTARTGNIWLNQRSSELPLDLVIVLDTFPSTEIATLTKLAANLARAHLRNFDRVGLVVFGGTIGWVPPASGRFQERLISERLLLVKPYATAADKRIDLIPRSALPRTATVMVVSGLYDRRIVQAIKDLSFQGHQVVVVGPLLSDESRNPEVMNSSNKNSSNKNSGDDVNIETNAKRLNVLVRRQLLEDLASLNVTVVNTDSQSNPVQAELSRVN